ncbi:MAG: NAD(P)-dependent oxidoreductase [Candidatus Omnitrophica bacterium]|nr:NAD(P)-dependent oxidoreductase [Candidatus Omnitrophota bacterium]
MTPHLKEHRVIITGACGAIGFALSKRLAEAGAMVIGLDRAGSQETFAADVKGSRLYIGDLLNIAFLTNAFQEASKFGSVTAVLHLAGQSDANQCEVDPPLAYRQNVILTANVLEASIKHRISRFIFPSTAYVYGTEYQEKIKEDFPVLPWGVYSLTKLSSETIIKSYVNLGSINADILRISNTYGPSWKRNTILGDMISQAEGNSKIILRNLRVVRDFIYMDDVIEAFMRLIVAERPGCHTLNLSTGQGTSAGELASLFCDIWGLPQEAVESPADPKATASWLVLDNQALYGRLGWRPSISTREGLKKILAILKEQRKICQNEK